MPSLQLSDIPRLIATVPTTSAQEQGVQLLRHELFTNDVLYVEAALDMQTVPASLLHLVPLFCRCVVCSGCSWFPLWQGLRVRQLCSSPTWCHPSAGFPPLGIHAMEGVAARIPLRRTCCGARL